MTSFFSLIQTIGSPLVGILLDIIGPRKTSILVYIASALSYLILANAKTPLWLYFSKIPTLLQHAFLVGQATVASLPSTESSDEGESSARRAVALGRMTTAYTIGATIGPALGGILGARGDLYAGARLAVIGSLISVILSIVYLKDNRTAKKKEDDDTKESGQQLNTATTFIQSTQQTLSYLRHPRIGPLLFIKLLNGVSSSAFSTVLPLILANKLHFSTKDLGYFMSASSLSVAFFAAVGISKAMSLVGNQSDKLAFMGIGCRLLSIVIFGVVASHVMSNSLLQVDKSLDEEEKMNISNELIATTLASVAISLSSHMHATSLTTLITGTVSTKERGAIIGLEHGLFSCARILGPPLGTSLLSRGPSFLGLESDGLWRVILVCVLMDFILMACLKVWTTSYKHQKQSVEVEMLNAASKPLIDDHDHSD